MASRFIFKIDEKEIITVERYYSDVIFKNVNTWASDSKTQAASGFIRDYQIIGKKDFFDERESFKCLCNQGYFGRHCEITPCTESPCLNDGKCLLDGASYKCKCEDFFTGRNCEETPCDPNPCQHNGIIIQK